MKKNEEKGWEGGMKIEVVYIHTYIQMVHTLHHNIAIGKRWLLKFVNYLLAGLANLTTVLCAAVRLLERL